MWLRFSTGDDEKRAIPPTKGERPPPNGYGLGWKRRFGHDPTLILRVFNSGNMMENILSDT
jgi:hypothetical protein